MKPEEVIENIKIMEEHINAINNIAQSLANNRVLIQYNPIEYNRQQDGYEYQFLDFKAYGVLR